MAGHPVGTGVTLKVLRMTTQTESRYYDPEVETLPRDQLERLQESRILQLAPYVYQRAPLIREVWDEAGVKPADIGSLADFKAKVPFIDKDRIRRFRDEHGDPFGGLCCADPPHLKGVGFTTGTTGDPTPLPHSENHVPLTGLKREMWEMGGRPGDFLLYALFTFREGFNADKFMDIGIRPITVQHMPFEVHHLVEVARRYRPTTFFMLSTPLIIGLQQYQQKTGDDLREAFSSLKGVVFGGEPLGGSLRALVESWGLEIFQLTSLGDISTCMECHAHDGMHTWEDLALVEHLDPAGDQPVADGTRGELVVTALADDVGPLIRYRTDDLIEYTRMQCSCGRTHGRMKPLGRKGDEMLIQGKSLLPMDIFPLMQNNAATRTALFQMIRPQREADLLRLRVGYEPSELSGTEASLASRIADDIHTALGVPAQVHLVPNADLLKNGPPNKIPRVCKE